MVVSPEVQEDAMPTEIDRLSQFITEHGGSIENQDMWGKRRLAYPIRRFREGQYILTHFQMDPTASKDLDSQLKINENILRHLIVRRDD